MRASDVFPFRMSEKSNVSRRRFLKATGGAASAVALAGQAAGQQTTTTQQGGGGGGQGGNQTLQRINSTMSTLDPIKATDTASGTVI